MLTAKQSKLRLKARAAEPTPVQVAVETVQANDIRPAATKKKTPMPVVPVVSADIRQAADVKPAAKKRSKKQDDVSQVAKTQQVSQPAAAKAPRQRKAKTAETAATEPTTTAVVTTTAAVTKPSKPKRKHNGKKPQLDKTGLGIGAARVKSVLMHMALNPREYAVRNELIEAENKPKRPKATQENPNPEMPEQGPQKHVSELSAETVQVVREAEEAHQLSMLDMFEREVLFVRMTKEERAEYTEARQAAQASQTTFNFATFLATYKAYDEFNTFLAEKDTYIVGKIFTNKDKTKFVKYNEWSKSISLVNKLCIRLSTNTRNLIASFLDCIVEEYARNGINNCIAEKLHIVKLEHALQQSDDFSTVVPLHRFVQTFDHYASATQWVNECHAVKSSKARDTTVTLPEYPETNTEFDFAGYIGEICRSVKLRMADEHTTQEEKDKYVDTSISQPFKRFCSNIVYEAILRIGACLRRSVERARVKTISDSMVVYTLEQIHNVCGIDFEGTNALMQARLKQFAVYKLDRKELRKSSADNQGEEADDEDDAEEEADEDAEDEDEVEIDDE